MISENRIMCAIIFNQIMKRHILYFNLVDCKKAKDKNMLLNLSLEEILNRFQSTELLTNGFPTLTLSSKVQFWFLLESFEGYTGYTVPTSIAIGSAFVYLFLIYVLAPATAPLIGNGFLFKLIQKIHNWLLVLYSGFVCSVTAYWMTVNDEWNMQSMLCKPIPEWLWWLHLTFVFSKLYEWFDSVLLVWKNPKNPKLIFLHVYHHATTFWLFLHVSAMASTIKMGMLLNGGVHFLMYLHYAECYPKKLAPMITLLQMAQLGFVTYVWWITPFRCGGTLADFPTRYPIDYAMPNVFVPVYLFFFIRFFFQRFVSKGGKAKKN